MPAFCELLDAYLELVDDTESPIIYHRWALLSAVSAILNRKVKFELSIGNIYPNQYCILIGDPAARKSTSIRTITKLLREAGYNKISGGKTSPEQFLEDLHQGFDLLQFTKQAGVDTLGIQETEFNLPQDLVVPMASKTGRVSDTFIAEGELGEFLGHNNHGFSSMLTDMWDNLPYKDVRTKHGDKFRIQNPTVSLLGGTTHTDFRTIFPAEIIGRGLLSRFILVYAAGPRKKCFDPKPFDPDMYALIRESLHTLLTYDRWPKSFTFTADAYEYSKYLYESGIEDISDPRFQYYNGRRDTHYRKLCLVIAAMNFHSKIETTDCFLANTILSYTEKFMPSALGEFGFDKLGEQTELIFSILSRNPEGYTLTELSQKTTSVVHNLSELSTNLMRLLTSQRIEKIQKEDGKVKYIAIPRIVHSETDLVNYNLLKEYRENPTFLTQNNGLESKLAEYELTQELQHAIKESTGVELTLKRKPGRPPGSGKKGLDLPTLTKGQLMDLDFVIPDPKPPN